jgi:hypothetical protein
VISRRAWQNYAKTLPKKPKIKRENPDDKPWPKNVQIAGYVAAGIFIPYTTVWFIVSNPTLREMFQDILPLDKLRKHFGEPEWDAQGYVDQNSETLDTSYYHFPLELSFKERQIEAAVKKRDAGDLTANLYLVGDHELQKTANVKGSTRANRDCLAELMGASSEDRASVAVDFEEDSTEEDSSDFSSGSMEDLMPQEDPILHLKQRTHTFSSWYHISNQNNQQEQPKMSQVEVDVSRLEYTIADIENSLRDPNCTRDIDNMTTELREAKRELSKLKWKRRLGMN